MGIDTMRLIVACPQCKRQYNASQRKPGSKFRCLCGSLLKIGQPRGHDAAVVRCSSCGAPREKGADACGHCGSDFTLHERDLQTVCPACLARVSDKARYCHHCGTPLIGETVASDKSPVSCPACQPRRKLFSRRLGTYPLAVLECSTCAGLWLGIRELDQLFECESRGEHKVVVYVSSAEPRKPAGGYRPCAVCDELMSRRNFARGKSGVIVDVCGSHGVWFDADELSHLIAWTRAGGLEEARLDLARLSSASDSPRRRMAIQADQEVGRVRAAAARSKSSPTPDSHDDDRDFWWLRMAANMAFGTLRRLS